MEVQNHLSEKQLRIKYMRLSIVGASFGLLVIVGAMIGCPAYSVYQKSKAGQAALAEANYNRQIMVTEAAAKEEASKRLAGADTIRAHGTARSNQIIGISLTQQYLQWYWIDQLHSTQEKQYIYVPSGSFGLPLTEATRLQKSDSIHEKP